MSVKFTAVKVEEIAFNAFLADEDKVGGQTKATLTVDGKEFNAMGDTKEEALADLQERINDHYNAQKHIAKIEIDKATGLYFFD